MGRKIISVVIGFSLVLLAANTPGMKQLKADGGSSFILHPTSFGSRQVPLTPPTTPINVSFNSPTISQGTTSVSITINFTLGTANPDRPGVIEVEIPVDPAVVNLNAGPYNATPGPLIPIGSSTYLASDLDAGPIAVNGINGIRVELFPEPPGTARINGGSGVFCTVILPILASAPPGSYPITASATSPFGTQLIQSPDDGAANIPFNSAAGTLTITGSGGCPAITLNPPTLPNGMMGSPYNQTITASGGTGTYTFAITSGSLPNGLSLSGSGGLTGTPTVAGLFNFTVTATANGCSGSRSYTLAVDSRNCPTISFSPTTLPNGTVGTSYNQAITAGGGTGPYTFSVGSGLLPTGMMLTTGGSLSGTPTVAGTFTFSVIAMDANSCSGLQTYSLTINPVGCPAITITPATLPNGTLGSAYSQTLTAAGTTGPFTFALTSGTLPGGLTLSSSGILNGTPTAAGSVNFTVTATAGMCSGSQNYVLTITSSGGCQQIVLNPATLPDGMVAGPYNQTITASGGAGNYKFTVTNGSLPDGLNLTNSGSLSGIPTASGNFTFTVTATASDSCTGSRNYTLKINAQGCTTITISPTTLPAGTVGALYLQALTASGRADPYNFSLTSGSLPDGVNLVNSGVLSGTPTTPGNFMFTVTATDLTNCTASQSYTLAIAPQVDSQVPKVTVAKPAGGESLTAGDLFVITWTTIAAQDIVKNDIVLSTDGGTTFPTTIAAGLFGSAQNYIWKVPPVGTSMARIRVTAVDAGGNTGSGVNPDNFSIRNPLPQDFTISVTPDTQTLAQMGSTSFTVDIQGQNGFSQAVTLNASASPNGLGIVFPANPVPGGTSAAMIVNATSDTAPGTYVITVTAAAGSLLKTQTVGVEVIPSGDFQLSLNPPAQTVTAGESTSFSLNVKGQNNFSQPVDLSVTSSDSNLTATFLSSTVLPGNSTTLNVLVPPNAAISTITLTITGRSGQRTHSVAGKVTVVSPGFSLAVIPSPITLRRGQKIGFSIQINRTGGFREEVFVTSDQSALKRLKLKLTPPFQSTTGNSLNFLLIAKSKTPIGMQRLVFTGRDASGRESTVELTVLVQ